MLISVVSEHREDTLLRLTSTVAGITGQYEGSSISARAGAGRGGPSRRTVLNAIWAQLTRIRLDTTHGAPSGQEGGGHAEGEREQARW